MAQESLADLIPNSQSGNMGPSRPPQIVETDILKAGQFSAQHNPTEQGTGAVHLSDSTLYNFLDQALQEDQEVFPVLGSTTFQIRSPVRVITFSALIPNASPGRHWSAQAWVVG
jgi:hypothetical protein